MPAGASQAPAAPPMGGEGDGGGWGTFGVGGRRSILPTKTISAVTPRPTETGRSRLKSRMRGDGERVRADGHFFFTGKFGATTNDSGLRQSIWGDGNRFGATAIDSGRWQSIWGDVNRFGAMAIDSGRRQSIRGDGNRFRATANDFFTGIRGDGLWPKAVGLRSSPRISGRFVYSVY